MSQTMILLCIVLIGCTFVQATPEEFMAKMEEHMGACADENGLTVDQVKENMKKHLSGNDEKISKEEMEQMQCFGDCMALKNGMRTDDNQLVKEKIPSFCDVDGIEACMEGKTIGKCQFSENFMPCMKENCKKPEV